MIRHWRTKKATFNLCIALTLKLLTLNKISHNIKIKRFKIPNYVYFNRYHLLKNRYKNEKKNI